MVMIEITMALFSVVGRWIVVVMVNEQKGDFLGDGNFMYPEGGVCTSARIKKKTSLNCELNSSAFFVDTSYFNMWSF